MEIVILLTPGLDNTRLFMSLTAGAGTRSMVISLHYQAFSNHHRSFVKSYGNS